MNAKAFREVAEELYRERDDLQRAFPEMGSPEYWAWANSHGLNECPALAQLAPPLPPENLRALVGAGRHPSDFLTSGAAVFLAYWRLGGGPAVGSSLLDFGCGCGRLIRFLVGFADTVEFVGADIESRHIAWASCNLTPALFTRTEARPPLPFPSGRFTALVSLSVFSHLPLDDHQRWCDELARVLAPQGSLIVSTLGQTAIDSAVAQPENFAILQLSERRFSEAREELSQKGFSFALQSEHSLSNYGIAFASDEWIRACWSRHFTVEKHVPGCFGGWQDGYLLKRRSDATAHNRP